MSLFKDKIETIIYSRTTVRAETTAHSSRCCCGQRDTEQYVITTAVLIKLSGTADGVQSVARSADPHQYCNALH